MIPEAINIAEASLLLYGATGEFLKLLPRGLVSRTTGIFLIVGAIFELISNATFMQGLPYLICAFIIVIPLVFLTFRDIIAYFRKLVI